MIGRWCNRVFKIYSFSFKKVCLIIDAAQALGDTTKHNVKTFYKLLADLLMDRDIIKKMSLEMDIQSRRADGKIIFRTTFSFRTLIEVVRYDLRTQGKSQDVRSLIECEVTCLSYNQFCLIKTERNVFIYVTISQ